MIDDNRMEPDVASLAQGGDIAPPNETRPAKKSPKPSRGNVNKRAVPAAATKIRRYTSEEKAEKVKVIDAEIDRGVTLKDAAATAGISDESYYNWKKAAKRSGKAAPNPVSRPSEPEAFAELVELEAENLRLRKMLSEKLRSENAGLRKRLGLDGAN